MSDNQAEQLDGDVLGEKVGDDGLPGQVDFPPDQMLGVNDPNLIAPDDVAMREARTTEGSERTDGSGRGRAGDLLPPDGDDGARDTEQQMLGAVGGPDDGTPPAEVDAMRLIDET